MSYFRLIQVFKYYALGVGFYFNEKFSMPKTKLNYKARIVANQNLVKRTSKIFLSLFITL